MKEKRNKVNITRFKFIKQELPKFKKKSTETMTNHVMKNSKMSKERAHFADPAGICRATKFENWIRDDSAGMTAGGNAFVIDMQGKL